MHKRFLAVLAVTAFVLTLLFAVVAGAQENSNASAPASDEGATGEQSVEVQQQQVGPAAAPAPFCGPLAHEAVKVTKGAKNDIVDKNDVLKVTGDYDVKVGASITIEDSDGTQATFTDDVNAKITEVDNGIEIEVTKEPTTVDGANNTLNINNLRAVTSTDVQREGSGGNNNGGGGSGSNGSGNGAGMVNVAQTTPTETTTADTSTADANTASPAADVTTANDGSGAANRDGSFQCEFFLRSVRDDRGALKTQYRGDELVVQRFEQCLSGDVLANTIPDRNLPFTGGIPLLGLAALGLASLVAGASVLGAVMRRGR